MGAVPIGLAIAVVIARADGGSASATILMAVAAGLLTVWIAWQDVRTFTISDAAVLTLAILALAYRWFSAAQLGDPPLQTCLALVFDAALPGGMLLAFREIYYRRKGIDGIGFGDVKLAAAGGLFVGTLGFSWALFAASLLGLSVVGVSRLLPNFRGTAGDKIAFGALLAPALWAVWLGQNVPMLRP